MTNKERKILAVDLNERTQYNVIVHTPEGDNTLNYVDRFWEVMVNNGQTYTYAIDQVKPYLKSMSRLTVEDRERMKRELCPNGTGTFDDNYLLCPMNHYGEMISYTFMEDILNWLRKHHFDYKGLIQMGLALEAPEGMYENK